MHPQTIEILETGCSHTVPPNDLQEIIILSQKKLSKKEPVENLHMPNCLIGYFHTYAHIPLRAESENLTIKMELYYPSEMPIQFPN